ncbi:MAG: carbamoyltransferase HypF [Acidimicrobiales bacterium]
MAAAADPPDVCRWRLRVTGTVQGVGFRPFVYRRAVALGLAGFVRNDSAGVLIEAEGSAAAVAELRQLLFDAPPPLARVTDVTTTPLPLRAGTDAGAGDPLFMIAASDDAGRADVPVSVDTGPCPACLAEIEDPRDRRHGYPFTNCTDCGPRYTIVVSVPYDRPATTMAGFTMCPDCQKEYDDPSDRRFHAQPNACPVCGPQAALCDPEGRLVPGVDDPLAEAGRALRSGAVLAVKGVGGYHLAADATDRAAVEVLRRRKCRDDKPFAVMVADLDTARRLVELSPVAAALLSSERRPIVLARRRPDANVVDEVAPGLPELGVMLPYSPLHHLLLAAAGRPLVMTSGNLSDEPIAYLDAEAIERLGPLVDAVVTHDRPIQVRCDDSVVRALPATGGDSSARVPADGLQVLRRSRGYAPEPLPLPCLATHPLLAVGAELKSTVAVAKGASVVASHHLGDLEHLATYRSFLQAIDHLCHLWDMVPEVAVHDLHPEYLSTKLVADLDLPSIGVQHHHAHVASCLVDHGRSGPVLGVAFDGLGYGADGTLWGGELLVADLTGFERVGHLAPVPMPGGAAAVREPWRMATAWVRQACGEAAAARVGSSLDGRAADLLGVLAGGGTPTTTSAGRLFDAVAAVVLGRAVATYEGQAAIELEAAAAGVVPGAVDPYPVAIRREGGTLVLDPAPAVAAAVDDVAGGRTAGAVSAAFHDGLAAAVGAAAGRLAAERGLAVALTGGVFQNVRLTTMVADDLAASGVEVLLHRRVPPNDGGISIGQAAIGAARLSG